MTVELLLRFAGLYGLPFAMFVAFVWFSRSGTIRWGRECDTLIAEKDRQITLITQDRDEWKQRSLHYIDLTSQATNLSETTVTVAKQRLGGRS